MHMVVFDSAGNTGSVDVVVPVKFPNPFATLASLADQEIDDFIE